MVNTRNSNRLERAAPSNGQSNQNRAANDANQRPPRRPLPGAQPTMSEIERANPVIEQIPTRAEMHEELRAIRALLRRNEEELNELRAEREASLRRNEHTDGNYSNRSNRVEVSAGRSLVAPSNEHVEGDGVGNGVEPRVRAAPRVHNFKFESFKRCGAKEFDGTHDAVGAMEWLADVEVVFASCYCPDDMKVLCATRMLIRNARNWWRSATVSLTPEVLAAMP